MDISGVGSSGFAMPKTGKSSGSDITNLNRQIQSETQELNKIKNKVVKTEDDKKEQEKIERKIAQLKQQVAQKKQEKAQEEKAAKLDEQQGDPVNAANQEMAVHAASNNQNGNVGHIDAVIDSMEVEAPDASVAIDTYL